MAVVLDIISSIVIGAFVILLGLRLNYAISGTIDSTNAQLNVQESAIDLVRTMEQDFRRIAYNSSTPTSCVLYCDSAHIRFIGDIDNDGNGVLDAGIDTVEWKLGGPVPGAQNPNLRTVLRRVNGGSWTLAASGVSEFKLVGYDRAGVPTYNPLLIRMVESTVQIENPYLTQDQIREEAMSYQKVFWRQTWLASVNLRRWG